MCHQVVRRRSHSEERLRDQRVNVRRSPASSAPGRKGDGFVSMSRRALLHNPTAPAAAVWQGSINRANAPLTRDFVTFVPRYDAPLFVGNAAG